MSLSAIFKPSQYVYYIVIHKIVTFLQSIQFKKRPSFDLFKLSYVYRYRSYVYYLNIAVTEELWTWPQKIRI